MHVSRMSAECPARYKYVHFTALPALFFDLEEEPAEFCNLADDPTYQGLALECAQKMLSWRMSHEDRALTTNTPTALTADGPYKRDGPRR